MIIVDGYLRKLVDGTYTIGIFLTLMKVYINYNYLGTLEKIKEGIEATFHHVLSLYEIKV